MVAFDVPILLDTLSIRIVETLPVTGEFLFHGAYDGRIGSATMNILNCTCAFLFTLLPITFFASLLKLFFTTDELTQMGVLLEPFELDDEGIAV
jgi:hypothetical protein